ncbi:hypothetical protein M9Y10_002386 [Tritrichomonas musculus]|uniref:RRM domain-containing protein n=1 Tax=Tritrichomonas musculus TaxID=1915356 RepID=A0ABR2LAK3_9EUKA
MSIDQSFQHFGYNPIYSAPLQYYLYQGLPSFQTYSFIYSSFPYSVTNDALSQSSCSSLSSKSKNSNTLFVKNLPFEMSSDKVKKMFEKYGEVAFIKSQIHERGIAFITFYDMRSAEKAYEKLHGTDFHGRHLVVDFSFKKNNQNNSKISLFVIIEFLNYSQGIPLNLDIIKRSMSSFGEIYNAFEISPDKYAIQYYDYRCSQSAARLGNNFSIDGKRCNIYIPEDDPLSTSQSSLSWDPSAIIPEKSAILSSLSSSANHPYTLFPSAYNTYNYSQHLQSQNQEIPTQPLFQTYQQSPLQALPQISQQQTLQSQATQGQVQIQMPQSPLQQNIASVNHEAAIPTLIQENDQLIESLKKLNFAL